jgi:uncharacterized protein
MMGKDALVVLVAVLAGAVSAVTGFGIGSLLTPVLALSVDTRVAVAAVSIPHLVGTAVRFWLLTGGIDRRVLWSFGLTSAAGGLAGAALYSIVSNRWLNVVFGLLLLFAAISEATGLARRMRFRGWVAWVAGAVSGLLGGLVGNQGGIRSAALLGFDSPRRSLWAPRRLSRCSSMAHACPFTSRIRVKTCSLSGPGSCSRRLESLEERSSAVAS